MSYQDDKLRSRMARDERRFARIMAAPPSRGETIEREAVLAQHVASIALAIEALETLLVERGLLKDNEVLDRIAVLVQSKNEQAQAQAVESTEAS